MTIVCGTDFSEPAEGAAHAAAALAKCLRVVLHLVHVRSEGAPQTTALSSAADATGHQQALLQAQARRLSDAFGVVVEPVLLDGVPHERLIEVAQRAGATLIVLAALGTKNQGQWLLGSVAERTAQCSPVPVLIVRDPRPIRAWAEGERNLRVMVGTDLGGASRAALHWTERLREVRPCDVRVVQVVWPFGEHARFDVAAPVPLQGLRPELRAFLERDLRAWAGPLGGEGETSYSVDSCWGRVDAHLTEMAAAAGSDLLVVGTHQRSRVARWWQGSVSRSVIHYASSNVACVPRAATADVQPAIPTFRSVLVPTDFSGLGHQAIPVGCGLVAAGGTVHVLYVASPDDPTPNEELEKRLRALVPVGAPSRGISTTIHVSRNADVATEIWHVASRLGADAICMSTHGRSAASDAILGSQARAVLRRARQPVVLVPPEREV